MEHHLADEQERMPLAGLRILARITAHHAHHHPDLYPDLYRAIRAAGHAAEADEVEAWDGTAGEVTALRDRLGRHAQIFTTRGPLTGPVTEHRPDLDHSPIAVDNALGIVAARPLCGRRP